MKSAAIPHPHGVLHRYTTMGHWKTKILHKKGKASRTSASRAKRMGYLPPEGGWVVGNLKPEQVNATGTRTPA